MTKYKYQCADGGPHIVLPDELRGKWGGTSGTASTTDDYGRACAVTGSFGLIKVGNGQGLVLAGSPPMVAMTKNADGSGVDIVVLDAWANDNLDAIVDRALASATKSTLANTGDTLTLTDGGLTLIFAGDRPGDVAYGEERFKIPAGTYQILTCNYKTASEEAHVCRLVPKP
jgi:hypothetical protein